MADEFDYADSGSEEQHDPPNGGGETAQPTAMAAASDLFVTRDENDEVRTVQVTIGSLGDVEIRPMVYGASERYFGDAGQMANIGPSMIAEILRNHVVTPDLNEFVRAQDWADDELTGRVVSEEMQAFIPMSLLTEILKSSGLSSVNVEMDHSGNAQVEFAQDSEGK